ncbi:MAG: MBL fold metallo-hydrolase [Candidatus Dojkabacteria bacterium]|nr:MBL fold metallo-hydrolase [Candidatus Dojkabacteria bacterium]
MAEVKVLIKGTVKEELVIPTTTLILDKEERIIVDPGMGKNKPDVLSKSLASLGLKFNDITKVFITHYHPDHTRFIGLFPDVPLFDYKYIYQGDRWTDHDGEGQKLSPGVEILHTPGHTEEHASLKVKTHEGIVVIAGDVWWFSDMTPREDEMAVDQALLEKSRAKILKVADWIIPGHGRMFKKPNK